MEVILLADRRNLGPRGSVVEVKPGYARNYLIPKGLALVATDANRKYFEEQRKKIDARHVREREEAAAVAAELSAVRLTISKRVGETETLYGSVTASEIALLLGEKGIQVDKRRIDLEGGIKSLGDHQVRVDLHPEVVAEFTVTVVPEE
jgi:large subunit ribosomal protein L9